MNTYIYIYIHTYIHDYIYNTYTHTHTFKYTHTHTSQDLRTFSPRMAAKVLVLTAVFLASRNVSHSAIPPDKAHTPTRVRRGGWGERGLPPSRFSRVALSSMVALSNLHGSPRSPDLKGSDKCLWGLEKEKESVCLCVCVCVCVCVWRERERERESATSAGQLSLSTHKH